MDLQRGFKARANRIGVGLRHQMGLAKYAPLDRRALLDKLNIVAMSLSSFADRCPEPVAHLLNGGGGEFSALSFSVGDGCRMILFNDRHSAARQNSDLAHEVAHLLLAHRPEGIFPYDHCRHFDQEVEDEASYLAGCILIPNEAAYHIVWAGLDLSEAQELYGVSLDMLNYRLNISGARRRAARR